MVLREQCTSRMESQGVAIVDSWETYVFQTTDESLTLIPLLILQRGRGRAPFCVSLFYISVLCNS
jgi:hypothetical protein